ncbi:putative LOC100569746 [Trichonephila clavipes]|uniref:Putative LOC100569746 n=1 Tax=Trichonephila clavipes TaxID=2585209 RepID=A0A8X6RRB3_TRICX|nr:putative LOC100569746 [Trichonephila clavipes]
MGFLKNDEGHNVTVNGDRYRAMITNFFIPELNNHDVQDLWFQQGGATCHTARATIDLLKDTFGDRLISRFGPVNWPPRSCDLTPLDYFLWGYVKSLVYADKPQTLDHLEDNIRRVIADIGPQMLEKVIENWTSILDYIRASRGSSMPEIIFKITGLDIIFKLSGLGQRKQACLQWIPSHVGVPGNQITNELAGIVCDLPEPSSSVPEVTKVMIHGPLVVQRSNGFGVGFPTPRGFERETTIFYY